MMIIICYANHIISAIVQFAATDKKVHHFDFGIIDANASDWHQDLKEHQQMADALFPFIRKLKNCR
ncbi:SGNH/GDSL hydrolase family protein [Dyadobacter aurulentus]|uniref:hypothetical protein n=1 Tax=Dyadobacter sp. UC 10 TaxID=2605428 RepID=UPI0011F1E51C|nr:hypothetical protein [Dyadobacter sp. UC 10]KAA0992096.1 hypothetical protein FXO21_18895 [Dyadobacter sp. UC 10]